MHSLSSLQRLRFVSGLFVLVVVSACAGTSPLLTTDPTGGPLFEQGQDALVDRNWAKAIAAFDVLLRNYPSSPYLAEARLGLGRAYYEESRVDTLVKAIDAFQGFLTYHPTHELVDYAQYMVGMTHVRQMGSPDRDQASTRGAIAAFNLALQNHPDSRLRDAMLRERIKAINSLALHELQVARWQAGRDDDWDAAVDRVKFALEAYPETTIKCELLFTMAEAYKQGEQFEDAVRYYEQVVNEYPGCELVEDAQDRVRDINGV